MKSCIWWLHKKAGVSDTVLDKVVRLASAQQFKIYLVFEVRERASERSYWQFGDDDEVTAEVAAQHKQMQSFVVRSLERANIAFEIFTLKDADFSNLFKRIFDAHRPTLMLLEDVARAERPAIFQHLAQLPLKTLLMSQRRWPSTPRFLATVDPLHENARPSGLDHRIVAVAREWKNYFKAPWDVLHSCFVAPTMLKYRSKIHQQHEDGLNEFCDEENIKSGLCHLREGLPEVIIPAWVKDNQVDVLVIGLVARSRFASFWIGSTTVALLDEPPCDMLLVTTPAAND